MADLTAVERRYALIPGYDRETHEAMRALLDAPERPTPGRKEPEPASENDRTGLPRPMVVPYGADDLVRDGLLTEKRKLPAVWINGAAGMDGNYLDFRNDMTRAGTERLCCICGDALNELVAIAAMGGERETSGGWGHPRCVALAVRLCPHFSRDNALEWPTVAYLHRGPGVGVTDPEYGTDPIDETATPLARSDLFDLARTDPWGLDARTADISV